MKKRILLFLVFLVGNMIWSGLFCAPAMAAGLPDQIRISLFEAHPPPANVEAQGPFFLLYPLKRTVDRRTLQVSADGQGRISLKTTMNPPGGIRSSRIILKAATSQGIGIRPPGMNWRHYGGILTITTDSRQKLRLMNEISSKDYVAGVVSGETFASWPLEAVKAQAVLTQTRLTRYQPGDILGDSTQQEIYPGIPRPEVRNAVSQVWDEVLTYYSQPIIPFYHAACGGRTSDGAFLSVTKPLPYLQSIPCDYCRKAPFWRSTATEIPLSQWEHVFGKHLPQVIRWDHAHRPLRLKLANGQEISGYDFWIRLGQSFGWDKAPGARFQIMTTSAQEKIHLRSNGAGHGLGLCQWGAAQQARLGKSYRDILHYYFPKTVLSTGW